jgi:PAS domain S-box-containing protein
MIGLARSMLQHAEPSSAAMAASSFTRTISDQSQVVLMAILDEITQGYVLAAMAAAIEGTPDGVFVKDVQGRYLIINAAWARLIGKLPEEIIGKDDEQLFACDIARAIMEADRRILKSGQSETTEDEYTVADLVRAYEITKGVYRDQSGRILGLLGMARDITERKRVEAALRESENRFKSFMDNSPAIAFMKDESGRYVYVNRRVERRYGRKLEDFLGRTDFDVWPKDVANAFQEADRTVLTAGATEEFIDMAPDPDGSPRYWQVFKFPFSDGAGMRYVGGMAVDITGERQAKETLQEYTSRLKSLSHRLLEVQEQERRYLARELHDEIGQLLTGLQLSLEASSRHLDVKETGHYLREAQALVRDLTSRIRDLSLRLRPTMLDDLGLLPALLWLFDSYTARTQIHVAFKHSGLTDRLGQSVETSAYRIVQEALTNVARHAGVSEVTVLAWATDQQVHLEIEDRGLGFEASTEQPASTGLSGMHERAALLGGWLTVESNTGLGTRITAVLPVGQGTEGQAFDANDLACGRPPNRSPGLAGDLPHRA